MIQVQPGGFIPTVSARFLVNRRLLIISRNRPKEECMLYWAVVFLVIALIAGVLGFTGVAVAAAGIAKILFVVFLILFLVSLVMHIGRGRAV
jgi:uncharacterized membrane protein YtjA (UPF0391 family)